MLYKDETVISQGNLCNTLAFWLMVNQVRAGGSFTQCLIQYTKYTCSGVKKKISNKFHF